MRSRLIVHIPTKSRSGITPGTDDVSQLATRARVDVGVVLMTFILWRGSLQLCCDLGEFEVDLCEVEHVGGLTSFLFTGTKLGRRLYHSYVFIYGSRPRHN